MEQKVNIEGIEKVELMFDTLLVQTVKRGITYDEFVTIDSNDEFYGEFQQLSSWNRQFGYKFNVYNDHLILDKKHFHFENKERDVHVKMDFQGNVLEDIGANRIDKAVHKVLGKFLEQPGIIKELNALWNKMNPQN